MPPKADMETLFKSEAFAAQYKVAEVFTGPFGQSLIEQTKLVEDAKARPDKPLVVLDNACGTGIISSLLNEKLDSSTKKNWKLICGDISRPLLEYTARRMKEEDWQNAETKVVDAQETGLPSNYFTHVFSAFSEFPLRVLHTQKVTDHGPVVSPDGNP
jgi:ubiquinone/menaquinone biosynthesis C-methylase UbiE